MIEIDPEFRSLIPPLAEEERTQLLANVLRDGCREPLIVWKGTDLLVDGHNRFQICKDNDLEYRVVEQEFADRDAVKEWIITNQLGRRNLTQHQADYLRGKRLELQKHRHGGDRKSKAQNELLIGDVATRVAAEVGVSRETVKRCAKFAKAVDVLTEAGGPEVKAALLTGKAKLSQAAAPAVQRLTVRQKRALAEKIKSGRAKSVDQALREMAPEAMPQRQARAVSVNAKLWEGIFATAQELNRLLCFPTSQDSFFEAGRTAKQLLKLISQVGFTAPRNHANEIGDAAVGEQPVLSGHAGEEPSGIIKGPCPA